MKTREGKNELVSQLNTNKNRGRNEMKRNVEIAIVKLFAYWLHHGGEGR